MTSAKQAFAKTISDAYAFEGATIDLGRGILNGALERDAVVRRSRRVRDAAEAALEGTYPRAVLLYDSPVSGNCYKVRLLFAHLGIEYERSTVDVVDRSDPRDFLDGLNPARRVPTLVLDDGRALAESNAILWYFGEGSRFVPDDRYARTQVLQWQFWEQYEHEPAIAVARFLMTYSGRPDLWEKRRERLTAEGERALTTLERHLAGRRWLVGETMTLADITLYAYTHAADEGGFSLDDKPTIRSWLARVAAEPGHVPIDA